MRIGLVPLVGDLSFQLRLKRIFDDVTLPLCQWRKPKKIISYFRLSSNRSSLLLLFKSDESHWHFERLPRTGLPDLHPALLLAGHGAANAQLRAHVLLALHRQINQSFLRETEIFSNSKLICPECRTATMLRSGIESLPKNIALIRESCLRLIRMFLKDIFLF
jgi:hypothetical protein